MGLKKYNEKRDFSKTNEPKPKKNKINQTLNFCVQKHDARNLHYDFRLEYKGMLLSWAVPKGPSIDPNNKRLAIQVEDHPLDYQYFEGVIPKGNYGAGTVEIWDNGTYVVPGAKDVKEMEKKISEGLKKGHFNIVLEGEKLRGEFVLQKLKKDVDDHSWLLIKKNEPELEHTISSSKKKIKIKFPTFQTPMLATLIDEAFDSDEWIFEIKWDGFRALSFIRQGEVELKSRNNLLLNQKFPEIVKNLKKIKDDVVLDGEVVVIDKEGKSHFQLLQNYQKNEGALCYYIFDILYLNGENLRDLPLQDRKYLLKNFLNPYLNASLHISDYIVKDGKKFFEAAKNENLEGIIGKKKLSSYQSKRSRDWVKIKTHLAQEIIICGFTEPKGSRKKFGALIAGIYDENKKLKFAGHVGGGFNEKLLEEIFRKLQPLVQKKCPFEKEPKVNMPVVFVKPKLIGEVSFSEWTKDGIMRQPIFKGLREDKAVSSITKETSKPVKEIAKKKTTTGLELTNLDKIYWPNEKFTKGDLLNYYKEVAPFIIPYLKNRPIILHRYPNGIEGQEFYQKNINFSHPDWLKLCPVQHEEKVDNYLMIQDLKSLLYSVNLGSIDLHPFLSQKKTLNYPDYCIIDLDPHEIAFEKTVEAALVVHEILNSLSVKHYCKTSGGNGLHIMIPLRAKYTYEQSRQFAEIICSIVHKKLPKTTSMERSPQKRPKKIYLDCLQNRFGQSIAAPYTVRPRPKAKISTPLLWEEVNHQLDPTTFTIETVPGRIKMLGDILKPLLKESVNLQKALKLIESKKLA